MPEKPRFVTVGFSREEYAALESRAKVEVRSVASMVRWLVVWGMCKEKASREEKANDSVR